jgi:hypothetical protein
LYAPVKLMHMREPGMYMSAVNLKAESQMRVGSRRYAPVRVVPVT